MRDMDSGEELVFPCKRWLSRDHDDYETCREIPAARRGELALPIVKYEVEVTTGDMWNGGSDANVYLTIYGEKGDTGVRQLFPGKKKCFQQGQTDHFLVEAVSLGQIKRVIIGHDATESGKGWYLEKLVVKDPWDTARFHCGRWLDGGEDDGKIVREIKAQDEYDDVLEKRNWEIERWKYQKGNDVRLFSILTNKCLRIHENGAVDGLGNSQDKSTVLRISRAVQRKCVFQSVEHPEKHLALNNGKISGDGTGGPYCEFLVRVQPDRTIMLESYKFPVQLFSFNKSGHPGDTRIYDSTPPRLFRTYCKGVFRDQGVIVLYTSTEQAIGLEKDDPTRLTALGKRNNFAKFRVHKVTNNVRKFESLAEDNCFIRMKDGEVRCQDIDDSCTHFVLEKHKTEGFVSLQSVVYRGLFIGITADGSLKSTVDTGSNNTRLYPEVIEWGNKKCTELVPFDNKVEKLEDETEILQHSQGVSDTDPQAISPQMSRHENTPEIHQSRRSSEDRKEYENNLDDAVKNITSDVIEDATHQVNEELGPEEKSNSAGSKHERVFGTGISRNNSNEGNDISKNTQDEKVREHSRMSGKSVKSNKENENDKTETEDSNLQNRSMSAKSERSAKADNDKIISEKSDVHDRRTTSARSIKSIQDHEKRVESPDKDGKNQRPESVKSSSVKDVEKNIQADNTENEEQNSSSAERAHSSTADRENVPSDEKMRTASAKSTKSSKNDEVEFGNTGNKDDTIGSAKSSRSHKLSDERSVTPRQSISEDARPDSRNSTKESRPDSRHSTKESRPDSRHSTKESRPDSRHSTKESRPDSRHSTKESRPDSRLSTKESRPDSRHSTKESRQDSRHSTKENSHDTDIQKTYIN